MIIEVNELTLPELEIYASYNEVQLKRINEPDLGIFIAETPNVILRALNAGYEIESMLIEEKYLKETMESQKDDLADTSDQDQVVAEIIERAGEVPIYCASMEVLSRISGFKQTRGVLCAMKRRPMPSLQEVLKDASRIVIMENVENPTNVGAIFRSAAGLGIDSVVLTFRCSDPLYRRSARVSMGTVFQIPWTFVGNKRGGWPSPALQEIKDAGFKLVSMALSDRAVFLDDPVLQQEEKLAIVMGNESEGILEETLAASDYVVKIPMMHGVDSLNVAAASAVTFWELRKR